MEMLFSLTNCDCLRRWVCMFKPAIIIPCYNHGGTMEKVIDAISPFGVDIVVVDDGSEQQTRDILVSLSDHPLVTLLTMKVNSGKGGAVLHAFRNLIDAGYSHAIQVDADAQHNFEDIPRVLKLSESNPDRMILGKPVYDESVPKSRLHGRKISNFWTAVNTLSFDIHDALCGFRCYPLDAVDRVMKKYPVGDRMTFDPSIAVYLSWEGVRSINFDTKVKYPEAGISHFRVVEDNVALSKFFAGTFFRMILRSPLMILRRLFSSKSRSWHAIPERGSLLGMKIMLTVYRLVGPRLIWLLIDPVLFYFFITGKSARNHSREYLTRLFEQGAYPHRPKLMDSYRHFRSFAQAILDRLRIYLGEGKAFELTWHGRELIDSYLDEKRGVLLTGAHLGSFELLRLLADERDSEKVHALMYTKQAELINRVFRGVDGAKDLTVIGLEDMNLEKMLLMRDIVERGEHIGILADRPAASAEDRVELVSFLGSPAPFPVGPWQLAGFLKAPVLLIFGVRTGRDRYEIFCEEFQPVLNSRGKRDLKATTEAYAARVEHYCRQFPEQWFNFYDFWYKRD